MNISITHELYSGWSLEEAAIAIKDAGFSHINFSSGGIKKLIGESYDQIIKTRDMIHAQNLSIDWIHAPYVLPSLYSEEPEKWAVSLAAIRTAVNIAGLLRARSVIVHPTNGGYTQDLDEAASYNALHKALTVLVDDGKRNNVRIALENMTEPATHELTSRLIESIDGLGMCFDSGHAHLHNATDFFLDRCGDRIVALHLHDNNGTGDRHLIPGDGDINWPELIDKLISKGYAGVWGIECEQKIGNYPGEGKELALKAYAFMNQIISQA